MRHLWVVMRPQRWSDMEVAYIAPIIRPAERMFGHSTRFLPVYETREEAEADYPDGPFEDIAIQEAIEGSDDDEGDGDD